MTFSRLTFAYALHNRIRVGLTVAGIAVVVAAFSFLHTTVQAWYAGVAAASQNRLITRHAASLSIHLPRSHESRLAALPGVTGVTYANWFGGVFRDAKGFFPQFAVDPASYLDLHPDLILASHEREAFIADRRGCLIGAKLASQYGLTFFNQRPNPVPLLPPVFPTN